MRLSSGPRSSTNLHRKIIQCQYAPTMGFPEPEQQPSVLLFYIDIQFFSDKDFHFFVQFCDSFAECTSRSMYRFLSQEAGIPEIRITQEFIIFLRDEIVPVSSGVFHEETRQRSGQKRGVQKRGTAPLGTVILSFLSVPYRILRTVCPMMSLASRSACCSSNGTHDFFFFL